MNSKSACGKLIAGGDAELAVKPDHVIGHSTVKCPQPAPPPRYMIINDTHVQCCYTSIEDKTDFRKLFLILSDFL